MQLEGKRLLLADDEKLNQMVLKRQLEKQRCVVVTADNGKIAFEMFQSDAFDLVLLDINMPVMDGYESATLMKIFCKNVPIIALTASDYETVAQKLKESGFDDFVEKPVDLNILLSKANSWLSKNYSENI